jgi:hypothetical protein
MLSVRDTSFTPSGRCGGAAAIAVREIRAFLVEHPLPELVVLVAFDPGIASVLRSAVDT